MRKFWISFIALLMGVVIGVGIWHGIAYKDKLESFAKDSWDKIKSVFVKKDNNQPTPNEEQINLDGLYYLVVDGDTTFVQIKDSKYGTINGYVKDSKIYLANDWETDVELEPYHTTEDDKYLHVFVTDQANGQEYKIAIYDKAAKKLYYDFSNGDQFPDETYEEQLLVEMIKFENFELHEQHSFNEIVYSCAPSCYDAGREIRQCLCGKTETVETSSALGHNYVDGKCTRCGEAETTIITPEIAINDNVLTINNFDGNGTVNLYYRELGTDAWSSYVAGPVDEFDLTILLSRDWQPMERGKTYEIYVVFSNDNQQSSDSNIVEYAPECEHNFEKITCSTTCVSDGTEVEECSICGFKRYNSIPAYGHNYVNGVCSRCGTQCQHVHENGHICPICGCEVEKKLTWRVEKPATCTENGVEYGDCICGYNSEMREIPATGHTFDAGICTSCNALDEEFYNNFVGYWFTETTGFKKESFGKYYIQVYKDGDNYIFTRSGYKVENGEIVLYQNSTDYSDPETWTFISTNRINEFTLTRQDITFNGTYDGQTLVVGDMTFTKTDKPIRYDGSTSYVTPL